MAAERKTLRAAARPTVARRRCWWAETADADYVRYHDEEWGRPVHDDRRLFEMLTLEGAAWAPELVLRGANERLIPILMTAAVTALGLAPLAFGLNRPGQEIEGPMAVTVLGGLISSTLLNLLVLPALAQRYVRVATLARVASPA